MTHTWHGKKQSYRYNVYLIGSAAIPAGDGNYVYAKRYGTSWKPVYIGQGDLKDRSDLDSHHKGGCIRRNGATHFHAHLNSLESRRRAEEKDLLDNHWTPCNG